MSSQDPITRRRSRIPDLIDFGGDFLGNFLARRTSRNAGNALRSGIDAAGQRISDASRRGMGFEEDALNEQRGLYGDRRRILREGLTRQEGLYGDQQDALNEGLTRQEGIYRERRGDFEPYAEGGREGISALRKLIEEDQGFDVSKVMDDPGYKFGMDEGVKGVGRFLSAKGTLGSGQVKDFIRFANDYATTKVNDAFSRHQQQRRSRFDEVMGLTGFGERAAANQSDVSGEFGRQIGDNAINQANITGRFADRVGDTAFGESDIAGDFGDQIGRSATNRSALTLAEGANLADLELVRGNVGADQAVQQGNATSNIINSAVGTGMSLLDRYLGGGGGETGGIDPDTGMPDGSGGSGRTSGGGLTGNPYVDAAKLAVFAGIEWVRSQAKWEANDIVKHIEEPFHEAVLAPIAAEWDAAVKSGTMTKAQGAQELLGYQAMWEDYMERVQRWMGSDEDRNKTGMQSINNLFYKVIFPQVRRMSREVAAMPESIQATGGAA